MRYPRTLIVILILSAGVIFLSQSCNNKDGKAGALPKTISYNFDVRPILSDKCFACHGPDANKRKAEFRLDIADSAFKPLKETKGAFALVPGKPEESEVYKRISSTDPTYQMPVPESHLGLLSEYEIAVIRKWIKQGAKYEKHWAFITPVKPAVPEVDDKKWVRNEIDNFILQKIEAKGLKPNEEADKERLLKRISEDITGLPPSIQMMD
ncbi:MAG: c-type cytochrome domain-containing protein, partial [Bacteroidota bacterium]